MDARSQVNVGCTTLYVDDCLKTCIQDIQESGSLPLRCLVAPSVSIMGNTRRTESACPVSYRFTPFHLLVACTSAMAW